MSARRRVAAAAVPVPLAAKAWAWPFDAQNDNWHQIRYAPMQHCSGFWTAEGGEWVLVLPRPAVSAARLPGVRVFTLLASSGAGERERATQ